jgi:putative ABC transport system permease protein
MALAKFGNFNTSVAPSSILLAFFFSGFVGILFGVWPARRAASLDPIQSLRYE